ncbi:sel1 repeat family protein [Grimontia sp. NTOU-MAR1]|uniref:sel1 repeat family protein n=1 Tax=Grimontia sp. NTOU-MAR1 TaxID=3111011 RepID=UPI002DBF0323|nr:sel1 repeat family protein [Grimontia sp. NTOU-MAR1]WRV96288.1 sel1 repeat family protein [Grimontia sp. NTOU-MAR1]
MSEWRVFLGIGVFSLPLTLSAQTSEFAYTEQLDSENRMKCLYGYFAEKTGDHDFAVAILEDCIARWNDVYSMLLLAQIHENGVYSAPNPVRSTALMKQGAQLNDEAGYSRLARYHYGKALYEGFGIAVDKSKGKKYLRMAAHEGVEAACEYLEQNDETC